jgi:ketosteroid isomerase-like protein
MNGAELAHRFFDAVQRGDTTTLHAMCTPDAVVWHNYDCIDLPFGLVVKRLIAMRSIVEDCSYVNRQYLTVSDGAVIQHSLTGTLPGGSKMKVPMMLRIYTRDDLFSRLEEYVDPAGTAALARAMSGS